jgi:type VI secretion system secreted protein VgrG
MADVITVSSSALPPAHRVIGFRGAEKLSRPYEIAIDLLIGRDLDFDMETALGERLTLTLDRADGRPPLQWHGIVANMELAHELTESGVYSLTLVPALWQLSLAHHSRIFVDETTPTIIAAVLKDGGLDTSDYELRLAATYRPLAHVCQYEETDLAFLSRWMEREGIYYFFEQGEDRERLIITDNRAHHHDLLPGAIRYVPQAGASGSFTAGEAIHAIVAKHARLPSVVKLEDYDYTRPDLDVSGSAAVAPRGVGEVRSYGENFTSPDEAKRLATVRAQALAARKRLYHATGTAPYVRPGYTFALDEHSRPAFNIKYLVTALEHVANQAAHAMGVQDLLGYESDEVYRCKLVAIPASVQFRPERSTPTPRVDGTVSAVVDGPTDSPYAQIDKQGRYKVRVKFDEGEVADGKGSMYVRMMQPHGGSAEGFHFPLRKGTEVMLLFLGGDPDQPIIAGVVPNAHNPSLVTADNHTKNVLQTGGGNRLEIQDAAGGQYIKWRTPHKNTVFHIGAPHNPINDVQLDTDGTWGAYIKEGMTIHVKAGPLKETINGPTTQTYENTREETTHMFFHQDIKNGFLQTIKGGAEQEIDGTYTQRRLGFHKVTNAVGLKHTIGGFYDQEAHSGARQDITGDFKQHVSGDLHQKIDGFLDQHVDHKKVFTTGNAVKVTVGLTSETTIGAKNSNFIGGQVSTNIIHKQDANLALAMSFNTLKMDVTMVSRSFSAVAEMSQKQLAIGLTQIGKSSTMVTLTEEKLAAIKSESRLYSATMTIFK